MEANLTEQTIVLDGETHKVKDLVEEGRAVITAGDKTTAAVAARRQAVDEERAAAAEFRPKHRALNRFLTNKYGSTAAILAEFGITPQKQAKKTVETKAQAAE